MSSIQLLLELKGGSFGDIVMKTSDDLYAQLELRFGISVVHHSSIKTWPDLRTHFRFYGMLAAHRYSYPFHRQTLRIVYTFTVTCTLSALAPYSKSIHPFRSRYFVRHLPQNADTMNQRHDLRTQTQSPAFSAMTEHGSRKEYGERHRTTAFYIGVIT